MNEEVLTIAAKLIVPALTTGIPLLVALVKSIKTKNHAKTASEKEKAKTDIQKQIYGLICNAEILFKGVDNVLRQQGQTAGELKKENVMTKLQAYALDHGYEFNAEYWSNQIDELVEVTKKVN